MRVSMVGLPSGPSARRGPWGGVLAMVEQHQAQRRGRVLGGVRPTSQDHRATPFELLFDLVYVFAVTQVTAYMAKEDSARGVLQGLLLLTLLWWTWSAYTWLGNQARADEGLLRAGMAVAMAAIFVVALTIPEAWHDAPGGLNGPLVLVGAYLLVRCVHLSLYAVAATGDPGLRRQVARTWPPTLAGAALLVAGALLGGWTETLLFAAALLVEGVGVYLTSRRGNWRLHSVAHLTERHGLFIILAIGESVVAIGVAPPTSRPARRYWWRPSWAWPPPSACGGCTSTWCRWRPSTDCWRRAGRPGSTLPWRPTPMGTSRWLPASCWPPWVSRACWPTPVSASRWAPSTRSRSSAASRCTWPGRCCSSAVCT